MAAKGSHGSVFYILKSRGEQSMSLIKISRILPEETVECYLNIETIIWLQDVSGKCQIMTVDAHVIECQDNCATIRALIKGAG